MGKRFWIILLIVVVILIIVLIYWSNYGISVSRYPVSSARIPAGFEGCRIVQLSDLHSSSIGRNNSRLMEAVDGEEPDYVVMTGDMVSNFDTDFSVTLALCSALAEKYPVYYIMGNHEEGLEKADWQALRTALADAGVVVLDNETVTLTAENGDTINLIGLWYNLNYYHQLASHYTAFTGEVMEKILGEAPQGYNILLTHNPNYFDVYAAWGADLTLSGHIHGGMIRLPVIGGVLSPETLLFPQYDAGLYENGEASLILSRGLGRGRMGIRLFNPPDVVSITLHSVSE